MKSFLYEIPAEYMPGYKVTTAYRIKCYYETRIIDSVVVSPFLLVRVSPVSWSHIWAACNDIAKELYEKSLASVDITPGDGCPHSDQMIID